MGKSHQNFRAKLLQTVCINGKQGLLKHADLVKIRERDYLKEEDER